MRVRCFLQLAVLSVLLCVGGLLQASAQTKPQAKNAQSNGTLYVYWPWGLIPSLMPDIVPEELKSRHRLMLNGREAARLTMGEYVALPLKPGTHHFYITLPFPTLTDLIKPKGMPVEVKLGQSVYVQLRGSQAIEMYVVPAKAAQAALVKMKRRR